jgi:Ser/Thr protein kinase RdoA (MazF antagonist)
VYALSTDRGEFVVKLTDTDPVSLSATSALEQAARAAGVVTPTPIEPTTPAAGYWGLVAGWHTRVSRAVPGAAPVVPATPDLAAWLGRTVATIASLAVTVPPAHPPAFEAWRDRLPSTHRRLAATLDELAALAAVSWARPPPTRPGHRDITPHNILLTADGPLLLDFDQSGPAPAWWELVHQTLLLSCADLGAEQPNELSVRTAVAAYADAGGPVGEPDLAAFTGLITGLLAWVNERASQGHVPSLDQAARSLPRVLRALPRWTRLLA